MKRFTPFYFTVAKALVAGLLLFFAPACAGMDPFVDNHEDLEKSIKLFNRDMESKSIQKASIFVLPAKRRRVSHPNAQIERQAFIF